MKAWIGNPKDFVSGKMLRPAQAARELVAARELLVKKIEQLRRLPNEINIVRKHIKELEEELSKVSWIGDEHERK